MMQLLLPSSLPPTFAPPSLLPSPTASPLPYGTLSSMPSTLWQAILLRTHMLCQMPLTTSNAGAYSAAGGDLV